MARIEIGRIVKPHGLGGEVVVAGVRLEAEVFRALERLEARMADGATRELVMRSIRPFMHNWLVTFEGVADVDAARELHGGVLTVERAQLPPAGEGEVYLFELEGLVVRTEDGAALGRVVEVMQTGATPILVVRGEGGDGAGGAKPRERLLPMSPDALVAVDTAQGTIVVRLLPGMEDLP